MLFDSLESRLHLSRSARAPIVESIPRERSEAATFVVSKGATYLGDANTAAGEASIRAKAGTSGTLTPGTYKADGKPTVWRNVRFSSSIKPGGDNDTFINCFIPSMKLTGFGTTLIGCELSSPTSGNAIVSTDNSGLAVINSHVHDYSADAFRPGDNETYVGNLVERLGLNPDSHPDGWQTYAAGDNPSTDVRIWSNVIDFRTSYGDGKVYKVNSVTLFSDAAINWRIDRNWIRNDGRYALDSGPDDSVSVTNNVFATTATNRRDVFVMFSGNVDVNGKAVAA